MELTVSAFNNKKEEWAEYAERLENYFEANDVVAEEKKRTILLKCSGSSNLPLDQDTCTSRSPTRPDLCANRFQGQSQSLTTRDQGKGERVVMFLWLPYDYRDTLSDMLCDRIMCGICSKKVQRHMLQKPEPYAKALDTVPVSKKRTGPDLTGQGRCSFPAKRD